MFRRSPKTGSETGSLSHQKENASLGVKATPHRQDRKAAVGFLTHLPTDVSREHLKVHQLTLSSASLILGRSSDAFRPSVGDRSEPPLSSCSPTTARAVQGLRGWRSRGRDRLRQMTHILQPTFTINGPKQHTPILACRCAAWKVDQPSWEHLA